MGGAVLWGREESQQQWLVSGQLWLVVQPGFFWAMSSSVFLASLLLVPIHVWNLCAPRITGFPCYLEVERTYKSFCEPKRHERKKRLLLINMQKILSFEILKNGSHRYLQTQFKALEAWCWDIDCSSGEGAWLGLCSGPGYTLPKSLLQNKRWVLLTLFVYFS